MLYIPPSPKILLSVVILAFSMAALIIVIGPSLSNVISFRSLGRIVINKAVGKRHPRGTEKWLLAIATSPADDSCGRNMAGKMPAYCFIASLTRSGLMGRS